MMKAANRSRADDFYKSTKWEKLRDRILRRDKYLDKYLSRFGIAKPAEVVHHIFPREQFPEYQYAQWNLISLTRQTHNAMHDRTGDELSSRGIELLLRTARRNGIEVPERYQQEQTKSKLNSNWRR